MRYIVCILLFLTFHAAAQTQRVAVYFEGPAAEENLGRGDAYQLAQLMGHFRTETEVRSVEEYRTGDMNAFDAVFFIGYTLRCSTPDTFLRDMHARRRTAVWLHTGMLAYAQRFDLGERCGFVPAEMDTVRGWTRVQRGEEKFTKTEPNITLCRVTDGTRCTVLATAHSRRKGSTPYIMRSGNFWYVADTPFALVDERDRYFLFADMLHDMLGEDHPESHRAIVRIEDVHPLEDPDRLRDIADLLAEEKVPFLIALVPYYINPERGIRVSLTDKPDFVDAIHYMVQKGGAVVLHGATHQYRGVTAADYEFWDINAGGPLEHETVQYVRAKVINSLEECLRNGIYPIIWETPHYTGSMTTYDAVSTMFSSAMEQRSAINSAAYGQIFPYIIRKDIHGQKIYPENLGYVQFDPSDPEVSRRQVGFMLGHAAVNLAVRDGFASFFFHSFVPHENLRRLVRGIRSLGYRFMDPQRAHNRVQMQDKAILTGGGEISIELRDQYLREYWFARNGELLRTEVSTSRMTGVVKRDITLKDGTLYLATPTEIRQYDEGLFDGIARKLRAWYDAVFEEEDARQELRAAVLYDSTATGGGMRDQRSFFRALGFLGVDADTLHLGARFDGAADRLLIVPYAAVEKLENPQFSELVEWIRGGGFAVTDGYSEFSLELGITYTGSTVRLTGLRERLYPEDAVRWHAPSPFRKFEVLADDVVYASDPETEAPVVIGRAFGKGRFLYLGTRFDPHSDMGYSRYPFLLQYLARDMDLHPVVRRDALEMYFDPGFRSAIPVESLVRRWVEHGVRAVYVGSWHDYHTYTYDYERLIRLCHENGILVYAWLEPPQISHKFWEEHPEWREKNVYGQDLRASWRYPLAMTDSACVATMMREFGRFLRTHDFDGVNIGETYFESDVRGAAEAGNYSPMHPSARREFARRRGFDPALLFDSESTKYWKRNPEALRQFEDYRVDVVVEMHRRLLQLAHEIRRERPGFSVLVTMLDNLGSPELRASQGIDIERIIALRRQYPFTLIVEDPMARWSEDPRRYHEIAQKYRGILGEDFMLDVNILSFRSEERPTRFPTLVQSGIEAFALYHVSSSEVLRTVVYAESSVNPHDFPLLAYASTGMVDLRHVDGGYEVYAPHAVTLQLRSERKFILVDGALRTSAGDGRFLLPAGRHRVQLASEGEEIFASGALHASLLSCTGTLLSLEEGERSVSFRYESAERCYVTINKKPIEILIDGVKQASPVREGIERYSVQLPPGAHSVRIITSSTVAHGIDLTSLWSSTLIVLFGAVALVLLILLYLTSRIRRRRHPLPVAPPASGGRK
jgi:uncharacterized protein YdaL